LKLSSFAALDFAESGYKASLICDLLPDISKQELMDLFLKETKTLNSLHLPLPKRLYEKILSIVKIDTQ
jgi:predicted flavoprotein YhiN